jgi:hypothetical protein
MTNPEDPEAVAGALAGDPGAASEDEDEFSEDEGVIGALGTQGLTDCAERLHEIGRSAHHAFGDRVVELAAKVRAIAAEARRRLAEDRLPMNAGSDEQRARIAAEHERRRGAAAESAAPEQTTFAGMTSTEPQAET